MKTVKQTNETLIRQVWHAASNNIKMVTIPKNSTIAKGDYVKIVKVDLDELCK